MMKLPKEEMTKVEAVKAECEHLDDQAARNAEKLEAKRAAKKGGQLAAQKRKIDAATAAIKEGCSLLITRKGIDEKATEAIRKGLFALADCGDGEAMRTALTTAFNGLFSSEEKPGPLAERDEKSLKLWLKKCGCRRTSKGDFRCEIDFSDLQGWKDSVLALGAICQYRPAPAKKFAGFKVPVGEEVAAVKEILEAQAKHFASVLQEKEHLSQQEKDSLELMQKLLRQLKSVVGN